MVCASLTGKALILIFPSFFCEPPVPLILATVSVSILYTTTLTNYHQS